MTQNISDTVNTGKHSEDGNTKSRPRAADAGVLP